jgi:hypothetical protein
LQRPYNERGCTAAITLALEAPPMQDGLGLKDFGKKHAQVCLDAPGLCPRCLERYVSGRKGGAKTQLVEEIVDGAKTGKWICPDGGRPFAKQIVEETGDPRALRHWTSVFPPLRPGAMGS